MLLFCDVSTVEHNQMIWDFSVLKSICVSFINIIIFVNYLLIFCILNFYFVLSSFIYYFYFFIELFHYLISSDVIFLLSFFIIWYLQMCLGTCSSFVNDCTAIIWYAGYKLVIGASLRTTIIFILKFIFALPLIQQNCSFSITDLLVNDIILISFC